MDRIHFVEVDRPRAPHAIHANAPKRMPRRPSSDWTGAKRAILVFRLATKNSEEASSLVSAVCRPLDATLGQIASLVPFPAIVHPVRMHRQADRIYAVTTLFFVRR